MSEIKEYKSGAIRGVLYFQGPPCASSPDGLTSCESLAWVFDSYQGAALIARAYRGACILESSSRGYIIRTHVPMHVSG